MLDATYIAKSTFESTKEHLYLSPFILKPELYLLLVKAQFPAQFMPLVLIWMWTVLVETT